MNKARVSTSLPVCAAAALVLIAGPREAAAAVVDLAVTKIWITQDLKHGACNEVFAEVANLSPNPQVEPARLELYVLDPTGRQAWRHAGLAVNGLSAKGYRTYKFTGVDVPSSVFVRGAPEVTVALHVRLFTTGWFRSTDNSSANNQRMDKRNVKRSNQCPGGMQGGGGEGGGGHGMNTDNPEASIAAWTQTLAVFRHARCTTCHAGTNLPPAPHPTHYRNQPITANDCVTCHHTPSAMNQVPQSGVGAPVPLAGTTQAWHMAPSSMKLTATMPSGDICRQVKANVAGANDRQKAQAVATHASVDGLVQWAFNPQCSLSQSTSGACTNRPAAPGAHAQFVQKLTEWANTGGYCP